MAQEPAAAPATMKRDMGGTMDVPVWECIEALARALGDQLAPGYEVKLTRTGEESAS